MGAFFEMQNVLLSKNKNPFFLCEDGREKSVPRDHRLSVRPRVVSHTYDGFLHTCMCASLVGLYACFLAAIVHG